MEDWKFACLKFLESRNRASPPILSPVRTDLLNMPMLTGLVNPSGQEFRKSL